MKVICRCLKCGAAYSIDEQSVGRSARCKRCGDTFVLTPDARKRPSGQSRAELPAVSQSEMATPSVHSQAGAGPDDTPDATQSWSGENGCASIPRQIGRFQIRARLGAGGFGAVYRAYDPVLEREIALKVPHRERLLSEQDRARVLREAKAAAQLRHANIVPVHDAGVDGHYFYIASAFIEGPTLAKSLRGSGVGFREAAKITMDLAGALQHAHDRGIVHRDVKPGNMMIDSNGTALLTDFGLAHVVESETMLTQEGVVLGTPAYMAPEQARGETNLVGPASDQYSLGVVLYQMLCGRLPFEGPPCAVVARLAHESPPKPHSIRRDVPRELESICLRAMAKSNLDRYPSCRAMADELDRWLRGEGPAAGLPPWDRAWTWTQRHRKPLAVGASGLALTLVLVVALFQVVVRIRHRDGPDTVVRAPTGSELDIGEDGSVAVTPPPSVPAAVPSEGSTLIGRWELNEGDGRIAHDMAGFGRHATIHRDNGNPSWTPQGLRFDSPDDNTGRAEVTFPNLPGSFSVEIRFMPTDTGFIVSKWGPGGSRCGWSFGLNKEMQLYFWLATPTPADTGVIYETPLQPGRWYTARGVFESGSKSELYINEKLVGVTPTRSIQHRQTDNQPLYIGNFHWGDPWTDWNPFRGEIDYVRIYEGIHVSPTPQAEDY